ncbi:DUF305 domain-containing protein [Allosaccharopolyspora coralli]|uniref:DUF305 domain-containing protein n=1 Tax=Allosaccharopolyspora coralli TaxID=2665642 RepID=A0A5Q3QC36_9PSEU|nr:DUF305 domain-containing protein [Allosaccharopolyspora coralli]
MAEGDLGTRQRWLTITLAICVLLASALLGAAGALLLVGAERSGETSPNSADVGFAQDMARHHEQGVAMASLARERSRDVDIRQLGFDIERGQTEQMGRMRGWLGLWSQPTAPGGGHMSWMTSAGGHPRHSESHADTDRPIMPGMATPSELERLRSMAGPEFDTFFLQLMIRHHQGGAPMMREAVARAAVGETRNLAARMLEAQTAEVDVMTRMLTERGGAPLPPPT